jgi:hypothetical protein
MNNNLTTERAVLGVFAPASYISFGDKVPTAWPVAVINFHQHAFFYCFGVAAKTRRVWRGSVRWCCRAIDRVGAAGGSSGCAV